MMYIEGSYNYYIVALSIVIAILASYSALTVARKIPYSKDRTQYFWLLIGALVMGSGVWSMHFIGMLAFRLDVPITYDIWLTIISMLASIISSYLAFFIIIQENICKFRLAIASLLMGSGIASMHYIGMEAMIMPLQLSHRWGLVILSLIIAFIASYIALLLFIRFRNHSSPNSIKWISAIFMGFAVSGMHYTGMHAAVFYGEQDIVRSPQSLDLFLLYGVTFSISIILLISWGTMFFDRHVLERMAYQDIVTGLPNRNKMNRFFDNHIGYRNIGVLFLDLDRFKSINDTFGHVLGDLLVKDVASRLQHFANDNQQIYRIGGDEFLFILKHCKQNEAEQLAINILNSLEKVFRIEGHEIYVTGSIGISIGEITDYSNLFNEADTAMYEAKSDGNNRYRFYSEELGRKESRKLKLENAIQNALHNHQFYIMYQPKWNIETNSVYGFEALLRWKHPKIGEISPGEFIPIAEETGSIIPITHWVIENTLKQCKTWQNKGITQPVSVNLSVHLFRSGQLYEFIERTLETLNLDSNLLELEITESMVFQDLDNIISQLKKIRTLGVKVSLDDFGTGYSSIALLDRLPIDTLKLDRLFIEDLASHRKRAIIQAIIHMAENLHLDIIAEGVENKEQINTLTTLGCQIMQGYYYSKPMIVDDINEWLKQFNSYQYNINNS